MPLALVVPDNTGHLSHHRLVMGLVVSGSCSFRRLLDLLVASHLPIRHQAAGHPALLDYRVGQKIHQYCILALVCAGQVPDSGRPVLRLAVPGILILFLRVVVEVLVPAWAYMSCHLALDTVGADGHCRIPSLAVWVE